MNSNFNKKIFIPALVIITVLVLIFWAWKTQKLVIETSEIKYDNGSTLRLKIRNFSFRSVCFSSCYPYFLEKKDTDWQTYFYEACPYPDLVEGCIKPLNARAFEASLPKIKEGLHRISISVCENCKTGDKFRETKKFYSNEFEIK